jgi:hypothetical protein
MWDILIILLTSVFFFICKILTGTRVCVLKFKCTWLVLVPKENVQRKQKKIERRPCHFRKTTVDQCSVCKYI